MNGKNIFCYNITNKKLEYEIKGNKKTFIRDAFITEGQKENKEIDILFFFTDANLGLINLKEGKLEFYTRMLRIKKIMQNSDLIIHNYQGESYILPQKDENKIIEI